MSKDMMMDILLNDGCTKTGAEEHIRLGTEIINAECLDEVKEMEEIFGVSVEDIENGIAGDIVATTFNGKKYYIIYAC